MVLDVEVPVELDDAIVKLIDFKKYVLTFYTCSGYFIFKYLRINLAELT